MDSPPSQQSRLSIWWISSVKCVNAVKSKLQTIDAKLDPGGGDFNAICSFDECIVGSRS
ncbi:hypothetical protein V6N11_084264 [Hibiscus sabdariffa]|uniref:Uncharacterized protein n=1 Tax=Hibiscus sabdariffa TaxID=183260 RepID=A0ABR2QSH9_9ROSI